MNGLIHRDYLELGSEVHIDIYDDRMEITSPGGMPSGDFVQELDWTDVASVRRNPVIADLFQRLDLMERRGSGFKKILGAYTFESEKRNAMIRPEFRSIRSAFFAVLPNLNYGRTIGQVAGQVTDQVTGQVADQLTDALTEIADSLPVTATREKAVAHIGNRHGLRCNHVEDKVVESWTFAQNGLESSLGIWPCRNDAAKFSTVSHPEVSSHDKGARTARVLCWNWNGWKV